MSHSKIKIHSVAACCNNWGIGRNNAMAWHLPKELKHFSNLSIGDPPEGKKNVIVMGRKTWNSIPKDFKPLKGRYNIVLSRTVNLIDGADAVVSSLEDLIVLLDSDSWKNKIHQVFNGGGSEIYKIIQESPYCGRIYLTRIMADYDCDTFFPKLDEFDLVTPKMLVDGREETRETNGVTWKVEVYEKRRS